MDNRQLIPPHILSIYKLFVEKNYELYLVGGSIRNMLLGRKITDWDLTTNATPEEMLAILPNAFYDNKFGTVGVPVPEIEDDKKVVEITTFRSESEYKDQRHPENVTWGKNIEGDLQRRDFTINAIALRLTSSDKEIVIDEKNLIDLHHGGDDLKEKIIRAVGDPNLRFKEDALRIMRAMRFATELGFRIEEKTWDAIKEDVQLLKNISWERIRDELLKILASENAYDGVMLLDAAGALEIIFPELIRGKGVSQVRPGRHHTSDVFTHNVLSLKHCPSNDPIVKLATLLHDVGKPFVIKEDSEGHPIFYNHEVKGAMVAEEIADRLRLSKKQKEKIVTLIRWHMFTVDENITDAAIRRFIRRVGLENVSDIMDLRIGDRLGSGTKTAESWRLKKVKERIVQELNPPFSPNDLMIDGNDIMKELNLEPGPKVGEMIQKIFLEVDEDLSKNNREYLLKRIHELAEA
ncbi:MAG TPA: CCA tRNA nucleotidyltransferase [Patescibacteria group bacterium]|nr:CCA tRNA nucleotidyltransferase [Patescibacteria group bacterium]